MAETKKREITVGSCELYMQEFTGAAPEIKTKEDLLAICVDENHYGHTKGGCTLTYAKETDSLQSDDGKLRREIMKSDSMKAKLGMFGWDGEALAKLEATGETETIADGALRVTKVGGLSNDDGKQWLCLLWHEDKQAGDSWWMFVGKNTAGFEFAYSAEDGVKIEPEFTATSLDGAGHLCYFFEEIKQPEPGNVG
ncbi:MAG: hypothetical protein HFJ72_08350 [Adlercreutzia sp.]|nr:hypothetical protein [Adlercreutzia sp.]